jgi:anthranilate synthase/aminodeoxychorismate synthase-like glutamine amidotransferase
MILMIDNYDSFTYNLVQMLETMDQEVRVYRNDQISVDTFSDIKPAALFISPGPGTPKEAGITLDAIKHFTPSIPILGVCLGHQAIAHTFGGRVVRAGRIMHGKLSNIFHDNDSIFSGLPNPFKAVRYHSLIVEESSLPSCLQISAWTERGEIMGLRHREYQIEGVQFHPESILTEHGYDILTHFLQMEDISNDQGSNSKGYQGE